MPQETLFATGFGQLLVTTASGREIAERDWSATRLGPIDLWPQSLKTLISTVLACPMPMTFAWGPDLATFFNDAHRRYSHRRYFGSRADTAMGAPFLELWSDVSEQLGSLVERTLGGQSWSAVDMRLTFDRDGTAADSWWSVSASPLYDDHGAVAGLLIISSETTERVLAERSRLIARERLREALAEGSRIGSWDWDVANDLVYADAQFALIYCVEPERAAAGVPIADFLGCIHPDDLARVRSEIIQAKSSGQPYTSEYRLMGRSGEVMWVAAQGTPMLDEEGRCVRFPGLAFDITANKKAELSA